MRFWRCCGIRREWKTTTRKKCSGTAHSKDWPSRPIRRLLTAFVVCSGQAHSLRVFQKLFGKWSAGDFAFSFFNGVELVGGESCVRFLRATRPVDFDVRGGGVAEAEVQAGIVDGEIAELAGDRLRLHL